MSSKNTNDWRIEVQVPPNSKVLATIAIAVPLKDIKSLKIQSIVDHLFRVAFGRQGDADLPTLVGLAAPQIGISKRIVIVGINAVGKGEQPELREFINPKIVKISKETKEDREGCFSTGRVCGIVERAEKVRIVAKDRTGQNISYTLEGFPARVAQHEIDHLDGIRFPDRITDDNKLHWVEESEFGRYRKEWASWTKQCSREKWQKIKTD